MGGTKYNKVERGAGEILCVFRVMIKFKIQQRSRRTRGMSNQSWIELCTFPLAESSIGELWHAVASHPTIEHYAFNQKPPPGNHPCHCCR